MRKVESQSPLWQRFKRRVGRLSLWFAALCCAVYFIALSALSLSPVLALYCTVIVGIFMLLQQLCLAWFDMPLDGSNPFQSNMRYKVLEFCFIGAALVFIGTGLLSGLSYRFL